MKLDKRLEKLEALNPDPRWPAVRTNLRDLMRDEGTPGTPEHEAFNNLYNPDRYENTEKSNR